MIAIVGVASVGDRVCCLIVLLTCRSSGTGRVRTANTVAPLAHDMFSHALSRQSVLWLVGRAGTGTDNGEGEELLVKHIRMNIAYLLAIASQPLCGLLCMTV